MVFSTHGEKRRFLMDQASSLSLILEQYPNPGGFKSKPFKVILASYFLDSHDIKLRVTVRGLVYSFCDHT
jgi:hypothetical protein